MPRYETIVDTDTHAIYVKYPKGIVIKYDIAMYAAALHNDKYWGHAEMSYPEGITGEMPTIK